MRTILLSLCLLLAACGTAVPTSNGANPAARPQSGQLSVWKDSTLKLVIPGTAGPPAVSSKTIEIPVKVSKVYGKYEIPMMAVYDPVANVTSVSIAELDGGIYISNPAGLIALQQGPESLHFPGSFLVLPGNNIDAAIAGFEKNFPDVQHFADELDKHPGVGLRLAEDPSLFRDGDSVFSLPVNMIMEGYDVTDGVLRLDLKNGISQKHATFWIDLKEHKLVKSQLKGKVEQPGTK